MAVVWATTAVGGIATETASAAPGDVSLFTDSSVGSPSGIAAGPDGAMWFTNASRNSIGRITMSGEVSDFTAPGIIRPQGIELGPDGAMWFTNTSEPFGGPVGNSIGRITMGGTVSIFTDPSIHYPCDIAAGPDGAMWFTNRDWNSVGRIAMDGTITNFPGTGGIPCSITAGPDGALWYGNGAGYVSRMTTDGTVTDAFPVTPAGQYPEGIFSAPDGNIYYGRSGNTVVRLTTAGVQTDFGCASRANGFAIGADGAMWVQDFGSGFTARCTLDGTSQTTVDTTPNSSASGWELAAGPDGSLWYTLRNGSAIGRLRVVQAEPDPPTTVNAAPTDGGVDVSWTPPLWEGDQPVTGYTATVSPGGLSCTVSAPTATCSVSGLANDEPYTVAVVSTSAVGDSEPSPPVAFMPSALCGLGLGGPFPDVVEDHPFCFDIEWAAAGSVVTGYGDGTFRPAATVTRQAIAAFLYRSSGEPPFSPPGSPSFTDVGVAHPFFDEVEWLAAEGIAGGYADGKFRPAAGVSRQALAAYLYRLAGEPVFAPPGSPTFDDVGVTHPFRLEVEWLASTGIAAGYPDGTFHPTETVTRQATAAFLHRFEQAGL